MRYEGCRYCSIATPLADRVKARLADLPYEVQMTAEAELALALAYKIDQLGELSIAATSKEFRTVMETLRGWSGEATDAGDALDEFTRARAARLSDAAG